MAGLLKGRDKVERESMIQAIASDVQSLLSPEMLCNGRLSFPQEAHVAIARGGHGDAGNFSTLIP
jgi:hypothetical protein